MAVDRRFLDVGMTVLGIANAPGANPSAGDQYIVGSSGTGAFAGVAANSIARYDGTNWKFSAPRAGSMEALDASAGTIILIPSCLRLKTFCLLPLCFPPYNFL